MITNDDLSKKEQKQKEIDAMLGHKRGCNCKKTLCRKKYCECFNAGVQCSYLCKCENCENGNCVRHNDQENTDLNIKSVHSFENDEVEFHTVKKKTKFNSYDENHLEDTKMKQEKPVVRNNQVFTMGNLNIFS